MIKDKITQELKNAFKLEIQQTMKDGKERGFFLCLNEKIHPSKTCVGTECNIPFKEPKESCPGKVQGDFHTHPLLKYTKEDLKKDNIKVPEDKDIINVIKRVTKKEGLTDKSPSHGDVLFELNHKYFGNTEGTVCIGVDYDSSQIECWTAKKTIPEEMYFIVIDQIIKGTGFDEPPSKWLRPFFEKEEINLTNDKR